jgi:hypothetical protein
MSGTPPRPSRGLSSGTPDSNKHSREKASRKYGTTPVRVSPEDDGEELKDQTVTAECAQDAPQDEGIDSDGIEADIARPKRLFSFLEDSVLHHEVKPFPCGGNCS